MITFKNSLVVLVLALFITSVQAEIPNIINYQGRLTNPDGSPVDDHDYSIIFTIYTTPDLFTKVLWTSGTQLISVEDGFLNYAMGSNVPIPDSVFNMTERYLGITVLPDAELTPRTRLVSTPYSYSSLKSDTAAISMDIRDDAINSSKILDNSIVDADINDNAINSSKILDNTIVDADINSNANINSTKVNGIAMTLSDIQTVAGSKTFTGYHSTFLNSDHVTFYDSTMYITDDGIVIGTESVPPDPSILLNVSRTYNSSDSVMGIHSAIINDDNAKVFGIYSEVGHTSASSNNRSYGVFGKVRSESNYKYGLYGEVTYGADIDVGYCRGGVGVANGGFNAIGLYGRSVGGDSISYGVYGEAEQGNYWNVGVMGTATLGTTYNLGVYGVVEITTGLDRGVLGSCGNTTGDYGVFSYGNFYATGTSVTAGGGYRIDHPADPENMFLNHSDVSSPEMKNIYDGVITLDEKGEANIELPSYFSSMNENVRYQLTPIGASMPNLFVAEEIEGNTFSISGGAPYLKVSWMVTGIRKDAVARSQIKQVEVAKNIEERGLYQNPEVFGYDQEKSIDYQLEQRIITEQELK